MGVNVCIWGAGTGLVCVGEESEVSVQESGV